MKAAAEQCCKEGVLDDEVPILYQDCTFNVGHYLVSKLWMKCHQFTKEPVMCIATIVTYREREVVYDRFWEELVRKYPLLKLARCIATDLDQCEDSGIAKHIPFTRDASGIVRGFRGKCMRHVIGDALCVCMGPL